MANPTGSNASVGTPAKASSVEVISREAAGTIAQGDVVGFDSNGKAVKADTSDSIANGYGVAAQAGTSGNNMRIYVGNTWVYVTADGAIKPNNLVKVAATDGQVQAHEAPSAANVTTSGTINTAIDNARDYFGLTVGRYIGHQKEEDNATDAADDDVVIVRLGL